MARKFLTPIDLAKNELQNAAIQNLGSAPSSPVKGQLYMNTSDNTLYWYDGTGWIAAKAAAGAVPATTVTTSAVADAGVVGVATTFAREDHKHGREAWGGAVAIQTSFGMSAGTGVATTVARADHYHGTPTHDAAAHSAIPLSSLSAPFAAAVADTTFGSAKVDGVSNSAARADHIHGNPTHVDADHAAIHLNALAAATGNYSMGGFKITSLGDPTTATDATNKQYVDNLVAGLAWKDSVKCATTANIALSGPQTIDGFGTSTLDRVLVKNQTASQENGIYSASAGAWTRATDADATGEIQGAAVFVEAGTTQADTAWVMTSLIVTLGTDPMVWAQFAGGGTVTAGAGMTQSGNTLNVNGDPSIVVTADAITRGALTGDVTSAQGDTVTAIAANAVTQVKILNSAVGNIKLADMAASTIKGRSFGSGTGSPVDLNAGQIAAILAGTMARVFSLATVGGAVTHVVTHNLNTRSVLVDVFRTGTPYDTVDCDVERTDANNVTLRFSVAPATNEYTCVVTG